AHSDHIGGMLAVINNFQPRELWIGPVPPSETLAHVLRRARERGTAVIQHFQGDNFEFGGTTVRVLAPPRAYLTSSQPRNNDSMVLHIAYRDSSILLEGDAEKRVEEQIAVQQPHADLLKIAHHGGLTSSTPDFLQAVSPRMAVISVGDRNTFGHPRIEVLRRLEALRVPTYRTDLNGAVSFYLDGHNVTPDLAALH
ncbi:MAG TPA: competence protein ComEC, partial [Terriglobales bacterium]|nr:competence protein ComEC [Terriglobales bacterium]